MITRAALSLSLAILSAIASCLLFPARLMAASEPELALSLWYTPVNRHLHQDSILHVLHHSSDEVWVATLEGITRFQGDHARHYQALSRRAGDQRRPRVTGLAEAADGSVLAATLGAGVLVFDPQRDRFLPWHWGDDQRATDRLVAEMRVTADGRTWLGLEDGTLITLRPDGHYQRFSPPAPSGRISAISTLPGGGVLTSTLKGQLQWHAADGSPLRAVDLQARCDLHRVEEVLPLGGDTLLIGTRGRGLWLLEQGEHCRRPMGMEQPPLSEASIHHLKANARGTAGEALILAGTDLGLLVTDGRQLLQHLRRDNSHLRDNEVISLAPARDGMAWVGTYDGLHLLDRQSFELWGVQHHPRLQTIAGMTSLPNGELLLGAYEGLVLRQGSRHQLPRGAGLEQALHNRAIMGVYRHTDRLFVAYREAGLDVFDLASGETARWHTGSRPALASNAVSAVLVTRAGNTLIGMYGGGLGQLTADQELLSFRKGETRGTLADDRILMLFQSGDGQVWVGSEGGLQRFDEALGTFHSVTLDGDAPTSPSSPTIWAATETPSGELWFGSLHQGLWQMRAGVLRPAGGDTIQDQTIYALEADDSGRIWYASNQGLNVRTPSGNHRQFGGGFGLTNLEFELGSSHRDPQGFLYFGGNRGYIRFHPEQIPLAEARAKVALTGYRLADNRRHTLAPEADSNRQSAIALTRDDYWLNIEYSALTYRDPESVRYRYRLRGLDPGWIDAGSRRQATYTNLPAGTYQFDVQATRGTHFDAAPITSIDVLVPVPLWRSGWALLAYAGLASLLWLILRYLHRLYRGWRMAHRHVQESETAAGRMADNLREEHNHYRQLVLALHTQQRQLLDWSLPVTLTGLPEEDREALMHLLETLDRQTLHHQAELYLLLHRLVDTVLDTAGPGGGPLIAINDCPELPLPWQAAMAMGASLWLVLREVGEDDGQARDCLMLAADPLADSAIDGAGCQVYLSGDFREVEDTPGSRGASLWRVARQLLERNGGELSTSGDTLVLRLHWPGVPAG